jgi:DEAD/DEAH box helicase domain-containing protein
MTLPQLTGTVDWYNAERGFGVIIGDDEQQYFVHVSVLPHGLLHAQGQRFAFQARPRRNKPGLEAFQIAIVPAVKSPAPSAGSGTSAKPSPKPAPSVTPATLSRQPAPAAAPVTPPPNPTPSVAPSALASPTARSTDSAAATRAAAAEVLELQRLRKKGQAPPRVELFPPGTRVVHSRHGTGTVVLAAPDIISVRFDTELRVILDLPRREIGPTMAQLTGPTPQPAAAVIREVAPLAHGQPAHDIASVMRHLADDAKEALTRDGLDAGGIYHCDDAAPSAAPQQTLSIDPRVAQAFANAQHITTFYSHQAETRQQLLTGRHVVIATPTASGKTESYNPTILETLLVDPAATALYLFPLVALGFDQTERLDQLNAKLPADQRLKIGILNANVNPETKRNTLRDANRIIVTTPETLHYILLPKPYPNWRTFFRNLRYLVLDEAHVYKGVFGTNMGHIVRRLLARAMREGNQALPQVIISSATVRDPRQLAQQLTGLPAQEFAVVDRSGAPRPRRHFLVLPQDVRDEVEVASELLEATTVDARDHQRRPVRTIVFLRSINQVKRATEQLRDSLQRHGRHDLAATVADFYADKADKQDVFIRLRKGEVRCLFTTNALMAGIDIGNLDVAVVKNFPGLVMDARQMFGRAGRAGEGAAIFLADRSDPFDQFYLERFDQLYDGQTVEPVIANPDNPHLLASHLRCAAQVSDAAYNNREGPLAGEWAGLFGQVGADLLDSLVQHDQLRVMRGAYYMSLGNPHDEAPLDHLRSAEGDPYRLVSEAGELLEEKRRSYAYRDAHLDAAFWHNERRYKVIAFDDAARQIICQPTPGSDLRTQGVEDVKLTVLRELEPVGALVPGVMVGFGEVIVTNRVDEYVTYRSTKVLRCRNRACRHESTALELRRCPRCGGPLQARQVEKATGRLNVPQPPELIINLETLASWLVFSRQVVDRFTAEFWPRWQTLTNGNGGTSGRIEPEFGHALHTIKHALLKVLPEQIRCDDGDIGGLIATTGVEERLYVYDAFPGGLGYAEQVYTEPVVLLTEALARLEGCTCTEDDGCLVCLKYFRCQQFNDALSKLAGRYLLRLALGQPVQPVLADLTDYVQATVPRAQIVARPTERVL